MSWYDRGKVIFKQVFQFKINTQIHPKNNYLHRYRILENDDCTIIHRKWLCAEVLNFINIIFDFLNAECQANLSIQHSRDGHLFGLESECNQALNLILLELKEFNFYTLPKEVNLGHVILEKLFFKRIRKIMLHEKYIGQHSKNYDEVEFKWEHFTAIYDWRGPDLDML